MTAAAHQTYLERLEIQAPATLWLRIGGLLVLVLALVLALTSHLNFSNYRKTLGELNLTRHTVLAKEVRQAVVAGLNIGLRPGENENLLPLMQEIARRYSSVSYVAVVDDLGGVMSAGKYPAAASAHWKEMITTTSVDQFWQSGNRKTAQVGVVFTNSFDVKSGAVIIGYDMAGVDSSIAAMLWKLVKDTVMVLTLMALITLVGVYCLTRRFTRDLALVAGNIAETLNPDPPQPLQRDVFGGGIADDINEFSVLAQQVAVKLSHLEAEASLHFDQPNRPEVKA